MKKDSTKILWRVQYRLGRSRAWKNAGLYETRKDARVGAAIYRRLEGFGNTRVVRVERGGK